MPTKRPYLLAAFLWLAMVVVFFWPVVFQGKVLAPLDIMDSLLRPWATSEKIEVHNAFTYDAISQYLPYDWSVYQSLRQDGYIGWNPYTHSGSSIVENTMVCPGDWHHQLYRFLPFWDAWNLGIILQFTIAGLGMLVFLRDQKIPAAYALVGVVAFGFYSQFTLWIYHRWILGAMCWSPWILWALLRAKRSGRIIDLPSIAFIGLAFRGGHLQTCIFVVLLVGLVALTDWWKSASRWNPRTIFRTFLPYAVCGTLGAVLALDVVVETVPALLYGKRDMPSRGWIETLLALPTLVTSLFPTVMGTPQSLDSMKILQTGLFSIKFMGAVPLLLAAVAAFWKQAPTLAKVLLVTGLVLPFTPADQWLYSRFTVVFALGAAWLASWHLSRLAEEERKPLWNRTLIALAVLAGLWLFASVGISLRHDWVQGKLHEQVLSNLPEGKPTRTEWMLERADTFLGDSMIWNPRNLTMLTLITLGIFSCARIHKGALHPTRYSTLVALCAFGELFLFASTWVTFSPRPDGKDLYQRPEWVSLLKQETGQGSILCFSRADFDYMQLNTPSAYSIRFAEGYETVTPKRIDPYGEDRFDPARCAAAGISHVLAAPEVAPESLPGWERVENTDEFVLFRNPLFTRIAVAELADGTNTPVSIAFESANTRRIQIPKDARSITLIESFNPGWKQSIDGSSWSAVRKNDNNSIRLDIDRSDGNSPPEILLRYRPADLPITLPTISIVITGLIGFSLIRKLRGPQGDSGPTNPATA